MAKQKTATKTSQKQSAKKKAALKKTARKKTLKRKPAKKSNPNERFVLIKAELAKQSKTKLVEMLVKLARDNDDVCRELEAELPIEKPAGLLLDDVANAIQRATDFDRRMLNHNFDYDYKAYEETKIGFQKLIRLGKIEEVKTLALELMKLGSYQVECSDEGLMYEEIADCLMPVIRVVKKTGGDQAVQWATLMLAADRVGCICDNELKELV